MSRRSNIFHSTISFIILLFTFCMASYPLVIRIIHNPPNVLYTKPHQIVGDYFYYLSVIHQGRIQMTEDPPYTTEPHTPTSFFHLWYLILGRIGSYINTNDTTMYYGSIFISTALFLLFSYKLISLYFHGWTKQLVLILTYLSGPFPPHSFTFFGLTFSVGQFFWTKTDVFNRLSHVPHHYLAIMLTTISVYLYMHANKKYSVWKIALSSLFTVISIRIFTFPGLVFVLAVFGQLLYDKIHKTKISNAYIKQSSIFLVPVILMSFWTIIQMKTLGSPWKEYILWESTYSNETLPIHVLRYISNFGLIALFIIPGTVIAFKTFQREIIFFALLLWIPIVLFLLAFLGLIPVSITRLVYGSPYLYGSLLTGYFLAYLIKHKHIIAKFFTGCITIGIITFSIVSFFTYYPQHLAMEPLYNNIYLPSYVTQALSFLNTNVPHQSIIMSEDTAGAYIPSFSHTRSFIGHVTSTLDYEAKRQQVRRLFIGMMGKGELQKISKTYDVAYVYWDTCSYPDISDQYKPVLTNVYSNSCISIYKIDNEVDY